MYILEHFSLAIYTHYIGIFLNECLNIEHRNWSIIVIYDYKRMMADDMINEAYMQFY